MNRKEEKMLEYMEDLLTKIENRTKTILKDRIKEVKILNGRILKVGDIYLEIYKMKYDGEEWEILYGIDADVIIDIIDDGKLLREHAAGFEGEIKVKMNFEEKSIYVNFKDTDLII